MRFYLVDALRGIAALWVVLFHASEGGHIDGLVNTLPKLLSFVIFDCGHAGVPIFFVLSGFVIAHSILDDRINPRYIGKFALRRAIRLDPPYWASIAFVVGMGVVSSVIKHEPTQLPSLSSLGAHIFYLQGILEIPHINIIFWTLCLEVQFYLVFCLLVGCSQYLERFFSNATLCIFVVAGLISLLWPTGILSDNLYPGLFLPHWHAFLLGAFALWAWRARISWYLFGAYALIIFVSSIVSSSHFSLVASIVAIILFGAGKLDYLSALRWPWLQFLGKISYSLYLVHNPVTGASYFIIYKLFGDSVAMQGVAFALTVAGCIGFAAVFWYLFEKWSIKLSKSIKIHR